MWKTALFSDESRFCLYWHDGRIGDWYVIRIWFNAMWTPSCNLSSSRSWGSMMTSPHFSSISRDLTLWTFLMSIDPIVNIQICYLSHSYGTTSWWTNRPPNLEQLITTVHWESEANPQLNNPHQIQWLIWSMSGRMHAC